MTPLPHAFSFKVSREQEYSFEINHTEYKDGEGDLYHEL